jgi:hypothetical protein
VVGGQKIQALRSAYETPSVTSANPPPLPAVRFKSRVSAPIQSLLPDAEQRAPDLEKHAQSPSDYFFALLKLALVFLCQRQHQLHAICSIRVRSVTALRNSTSACAGALLRSNPPLGEMKASGSTLSHTVGSCRIVHPEMLPIGNIVTRRLGSCRNHLFYTYEKHLIFQKSRRARNLWVARTPSRVQTRASNEQSARRAETECELGARLKPERTPARVGVPIGGCMRQAGDYIATGAWEGTFRLRLPLGERSGGGVRKPRAVQ